MKRKKAEEIEVVESSGNVYADLGFINAEEMMAKAKLAVLISGIIKERKLTQKKSAEIMGVDQPKVSAILRGSLSGFTIDRLFRFLMAFGMDIIIEARPHTSRRTSAHIRVIQQHKERRVVI
jgi:predicted XRE-type DNA-binding protein